MIFLDLSVVFLICHGDVAGTLRQHRRPNGTGASAHSFILELHDLK
jgi:hypothetical protein